MQFAYFISFLAGVLYDLLHPDEDSTPWCITIHFSKFPEDTLVKLNTKYIEMRKSNEIPQYCMQHNNTMLF